MMVSYARFWDTLKHSSESTYTLIKHHRISSSTLDKLRKNKPLTTTTINDLCRILHCRVEDIMEYIPSEEDQMLYKELQTDGVRSSFGDYQVFLMNFSRHLGQVMAILPLPLGTRTVWRHLGQV